MQKCKQDIYSKINDFRDELDSIYGTLHGESANFAFLIRQKSYQSALLGPIRRPIHM